MDTTRRDFLTGAATVVGAAATGDVAHAEDNVRQEVPGQRKADHHSRSWTMPLVRIDLIRGKSAEYRKTVGEIVYNAMRDLINVPKDDKFQIITEHAPEDLNFAESYLGNTYSQDIIFIQITLNAGRSVEMKKAFYKRIADELNAQLQVRREDVWINLVEVAKENWSFGGGIAQYATP
jgi:4-oxalocrotonate tautomerase